MLTIPQEYTTKCENAGTVSTLVYGEKSLLLYSPIKATDRKVAVISDPFSVRSF